MFQKTLNVNATFVYHKTLISPLMTTPNQQVLGYPQH